MPGLYSAGFPVLEGDYSSYSIYDSFVEEDTAGSGLSTAFAVFNRIETIAIITDIGGPSKTYTISSKIVSAAHTAVGFDAAYTTSKFTASAHGTYFVTFYNDGISIFKDGVEILTFTDTELGFTSIYDASFSPKGKYIAVSGRRTDGSDGWVILVGS